MTTTTPALSWLLAGCTGVVGQEVLRLALADPRITRVIAPTRRPLPPHPKQENPVVDFNALPSDAAWWNVEAVLAEPAGEPIIESEKLK